MSWVLCDQQLETRLAFASDLFLVHSVKICHRFCATSNKADLCKLNHFRSLVSVYVMGFVRPAARLTFAISSFLVNSVKNCHRFCATSSKADL